MSILDFRWKKKPKPPAPTPVPPVPPLIDVVPVTPSRPIRVTDERDGEILNRGYSYWSQCWLDRAGAIFAFVGHADGQPKFFRIDPDGTVTRLGPKLSYSGTGEGMYWTPAGDIMLCDGPRLRRVNPFSGADEIVLDVSETHPGCDLWQAHSDDQGVSHSATVRHISSSGSYPKIGTVAQCLSGRLYWQALGTLDESHVTSDGSFVIIEEDNGNRIISLTNGSETKITDAEGALAHIDCGPGYMVGEDDQRGACTYLDCRTMERRVLFQTWGMGHLSVRAGRCLLSGASQISLVALDGSGVTPLVDHGMQGSGYDFQVHGNLDPSGRVAAYVSNAAGRMDLYLLRL